MFFSFAQGCPRENADREYWSTMSKGLLTTLMLACVIDAAVSHSSHSGKSFVAHSPHRSLFKSAVNFLREFFVTPAVHRLGEQRGGAFGAARTQGACHWPPPVPHSLRRSHDAATGFSSRTGQSGRNSFPCPPVCRPNALHVSVLHHRRSDSLSQSLHRRCDARFFKSFSKSHFQKSHSVR